MKIYFLGTGASGGTPGVGKSKRLESSILIKDDLNILIDVTRDFLKQAKSIGMIDAVFLTHGHQDASGGISKLSASIPIFAHPRTLRIIQNKFSFTPSRCKRINDGGSIKLGSWNITPLIVPHARNPRFPTYAWKFQDKKTIVYASDIAVITSEFKKFCQGADILIIDGSTWKRKIFTHLRVDTDLPTVCQLDVGKIILTQIGKSAPPYEKFKKEIKKICPRAFPAYDGLEISV